MKKFFLFPLMAAFLVACGDTPTEPLVPPTAANECIEYGVNCDDDGTGATAKFLDWSIPDDFFGSDEVEVSFRHGDGPSQTVAFVTVNLTVGGETFSGTEGWESAGGLNSPTQVTVRKPNKGSKFDCPKDEMVEWSVSIQLRSAGGNLLDSYSDSGNTNPCNLIPE